MNADDPILATIDLKTWLYFLRLGNASSYSATTTARIRLNCVTVPAPLSYNHVTLSHMGIGNENCELTKPNLDFETSQIQLDGINQSVFTILDKSSRQEISSSMPGLHNVYNAHAA